ncbi:restriction endonuclease [Streptomyces sp. MST-110588]|uniref:restriction endonuclease n=1 Tax=Streptomyces sp. MST-110588 TaxID=2833628 RepID=UPI001F5DBB2C|nr:restriction endonuclease [Streptomyces sp. MST-110588]UNO38461.1 restriction endonuclease [Streptomyces sp. MST-110588]
MVTPVRRSRLVVRRPAFSLRDLAVGFGLVAIGVVGIGLTVKTALGGAAHHPFATVAMGTAAVVAAVALLRVRRRRRAVRRVTVSPARTDPVVVAGSAVLRSPAVPEAEDYTRMDADEFESAVAGLCERDGCQDVRVVGGANDLGADVVATAPDGRAVVIQCKRYSATNKVGSQDLQRFGGTCFAVHGAEVAAFVTTSTFTDPAADYARQCGILCYDLRALTGWATGTGPAPWE